MVGKTFLKKLHISWSEKLETKLSLNLVKELIPKEIPTIFEIDLSFLFFSQVFLEKFSKISSYELVFSTKNFR